MRPIASTLLLLTLAGGTVHGDVPASPRPARPNPPSTTFRTSVRVLPPTAAAAPARISVRIPRERLQALLARASRDGVAVDGVAATIDDGATERTGSGGTLRAVVTALALALAVLSLPLLGRRKRTGAMLGLVLLAAGWTVHADIAAPRLTVPPPGGATAPPTQAPRGSTEATALLEVTVTDDGSAAVLLMHATAR